MRRWLAKLSIALAIAVVDATPAYAVSDREAFLAPEWGVELELPGGWSWSAQATYPGVIVAAVHRTQAGARMTLAVEKTRGTATGREVVEKARTALIAAGFLGGRILPHPSGALVLDVTTPDRKTSVRQATYLHHGNTYVLTLAAPLASVRQLARGFDATLRRMVDGVRRHPTTSAAVAPTTQPTEPSPSPMPSKP